MASPFLTFTADPHEYRLSNVVIPSVTQILGDLKLKPPFPPGPYRVRGRNVHKATELSDLGTIEDFKVGSVIMGYVLAWRAVCLEFNWVWTPEGIEKRVYDPLRLTAGTIDRVDWLKRLIVDIKSGAAGKEAALQTAGYAVMAFPDHPETVERCTVEIHGDGKFSPPVWYSNKQDIAAWCGAVELWKWTNRKR